MRTYSTGLGILSLALFLVAGVAVISIAAKHNGLDAEGRQFVQAAIPAIFSEWNEQELLRRASAELRAAVREAQLYRLFGGMSGKFGKLKHCGPMRGKANIAVEPEGLVISGEYVAATMFASGEAEIGLSLVKRQGEWRITSFRLDSALF